MTDDGTEGSSRDHFTFKSPTFATYRREPWKANPLRVRRTDWRPRLARNCGCPALRPFRLPVREPNQFPYARRASWHACTSATDATSPGHSRPGAVFASVITRRCTSVPVIFSPR